MLCLILNQLTVPICDLQMLIPAWYASYGYMSVSIKQLHMWMYCVPVTITHNVTATSLCYGSGNIYVNVTIAVRPGEETND